VFTDGSSESGSGGHKGDKVVDEAAGFFKNLTFSPPAKSFATYSTPSKSSSKHATLSETSAKKSSSSKLSSKKGINKKPSCGGGAKPNQPSFAAGYEAALHILESQNGTKENPFFVPINPEFPERNVAGFFVQHVEKMRYGRYERNGYHIRIMCDPSYELWQGSIPEDFDNELAERVVQVRRPSVPEPMKDNEHYHRKSTTCDRTKDAHESTLNDIGNDENRQWLYFWLVFPKGTVLDNRVFSADDNVVETVPLGLTVKSVSTMSAYWRIGEKGGKRINSAAGKHTMADLFK
jgi:hypothetical protein